MTAELVCYARSAGVQWDRMEAGTLGEDLNPWATKLFDTLKRADPKTPTEQAAYSKWLDERSAREEARSDRIHGAIGVIPSPLWLVLFFTSGLIFVYMLFFADSGERAITQALLMGTVVAVIVTMLLLLQYVTPEATPCSGPAMELARTPNPTLAPRTAQWGSGRHTYVAKRVGRAGGAVIQPKGMTAWCRRAVGNARDTL